LYVVLKMLVRDRLTPLVLLSVIWLSVVTSVRLTFTLKQLLVITMELALRPFTVSPLVREM
jgi:hypothetical protein